LQKCKQTFVPQYLVLSWR